MFALEITLIDYMHEVEHLAERLARLESAYQPIVARMRL